MSVAATAAVSDPSSSIILTQVTATSSIHTTVAVFEGFLFLPILLSDK
jgi:hypothetical protein